MKRKIMDTLVKWREKENSRLPLLLSGARQVGKTYVMRKLGAECFKNTVYVNFEADRKIGSYFETDIHAETIIGILEKYYQTKIIPDETLIIFDEIQKFPKAREAIKYLVADGRYDFIETGSLISIRENVDDITIPSEERKLKMYPVDFEEFAMYLREELLLEYIRKCYEEKVPLERKIHEKAMHLFKEYMLVGGMPQAVVAFAENGRDFFLADVEKRDILNLYRDDIKKAAKRYNSKVSALFENIPAYLSTHEKKIVLSEIDPGATFDRYDEPLFWLDDSMICNLCYKCNDPNVGFALNKNDSAVKCYMGDTGLLVSLAFNENEIMNQQLYKLIMNDKLSLNEGMRYENAISQIRASKGKKLYFYTRYSKEKHRNDIEIDFLLSNESKMNFKVFPVEVKSSKNYTATSLIRFKESFDIRIDMSYIVHPKNLIIDNGIIKMPPYMFSVVI